jgi:hypothetical protein
MRLNLTPPLIALAVVSACSEIYLPEFGEGLAPEGTPSGETTPPGSFAAAVLIDTATGPGGAAPPEISPILFGASERAGRIGLDSGEDVQGYVAHTYLRLLRWGGTEAESFDWEADDFGGLLYTTGDGNNPVRPQIGLLEFLDLCRYSGVTPLVTVGAQIDDPAKAARLVEFLNSPDTGAGMGRKRAEQGRPAPYGVALFEIGDDPVETLPRNRLTRCHWGKAFSEWRPCAESPDSGGDSSYFSGGDYADLVSRYAASMRAAPGGGDISIVAAGFPDAVAVKEAEAPGTVDFLDERFYPFTGAAAYPEWGQEGQVLDAVHGGVPAPCGCGTLPSVGEWLAQRAAPLAGTGIKLLIGEWNMDADGALPIMGSFPSALWAADVLGHMAAAGTAASAFYSIESGRGSPSPEAGDFGYMLYEPDTGRHLKKALRAVFQFYGLFFFGAYVLSASTDARVEAHAAYDDAAGGVTVIAINRDPLHRADVSIAFKSGAPAPFAAAWSVEEDAPDKVTGTTGPRPDRVWCERDFSRCSLPPHSVSVILGQ